MDDMRKTIKLDDEPGSVSFDTGSGLITVPVEPYNGPGLYEVAMNVLWND